MRLKAIREEARRLVSEFGPTAYETALKEVQKARGIASLGGVVTTLDSVTRPICVRRERNVRGAI